MRDRVAAGFRSLLSGEPDGRPPWVTAIEEGTDPGLFGPGSAAWAVHGDLATLVGGVRALLMQTLHPAALAGVRGHSRYEQDPLDRLRGTTRWLVSLTFADTATAERETERVRLMHERVRGTYDDPASGGRSAYAASDPTLLRWVHVAFTDSFLAAHQRYGRTPIPGGPDQYVSEWAVTARMLGLDDPPETEAELSEQLASFAPVLAVNDSTREILRFLERPPLPLPAQPAYAVLRSAAVVTMSDTHRRALELSAPPGALVDPVVHGMFRAMHLALGPRSPSEQAARRRMERVESPVRSPQP